MKSDPVAVQCFVYSSSYFCFKNNKLTVDRFLFPMKNFNSTHLSIFLLINALIFNHFFLEHIELMGVFDRNRLVV